MSYIQRNNTNYNTRHDKYRFFGIISNRISNNKRREDNEYHRRYHKSRFTQNILQLIIVILQGALVFVTWRLVESANKQANSTHTAAIATKESAKATQQSAAATKSSVEAIEKSIDISRQAIAIQEKSMKIANRAYLSMHKIEPKKINDFRFIKINIWFINTGQTPAYNIQSWSNLETRKTCSDTLIRNPNQSIKATIVGKDGKFGIDREIFIDKIKIDKIKSGKLFINFTGTIVYKDIFNQQHFFEYNIVYNIKDEQFVYCPKHNNAN